MNERQEERNRYKIAAKAAAAAAAAAASDVESGMSSRPLPRPIASSSRPRISSILGSNAIAAAAEAKERQNFLKKFSPIDLDNELEKESPSSGGIVSKMFELEKSSSKSNSVNENGVGRGVSLGKKKGTSQAAKGIATTTDGVGDDEYDYSSEDENDDDDEDDTSGDEDSTNEAEEDLRSLERSSPKSVLGNLRTLLC
jgi:hypothetical protein